MPVRESQERGHVERMPGDGDEASPASTDPLSESVLEAVVDRLYTAVLADADLASYFDGASLDKVKRMQRELFGAALGQGPMFAASRLQEAHAHLHLEPHHVSRFFEHLVDALNDADVEADDVERLISRLGTYVDDVTGSHGEGG
jgi:hemoglobin